MTARPRWLPTLLLVTLACARPIPVDQSASISDTTAAAPVQARWSGSLRAPGGVIASPVIVSGGGGGGASATAHGSVTLVPLADPVGRVRYELTVTIPSVANQQVAWALFTGSCTTPSPPVVPPNELQVIDLDGGGSGQVRGTFTAVLDRKQTYNLRVYLRSRATDTNNIALCNRLDYSGPR